MSSEDIVLVLVPRKHWFHSDIAEKLLPGTLNHKNEESIQVSELQIINFRALAILCYCFSKVHLFRIFFFIMKFKVEPHHEKTGLLAMRKTKAQISFAVTAKLISAFVFATRVVQFLFFLNPKFQASSHLL